MIPDKNYFFLRFMNTTRITTIPAEIGTITTVTKPNTSISSSDVTNTFISEGFIVACRPALVKTSIDLLK